MMRDSSHQHGEEFIAAAFAPQCMELMSEVRARLNDAEALIDDDLWSLPKFSEMLYFL